MKALLIKLACAATSCAVVMNAAPAMAENLLINGSFDEFDLTEGQRGESRTNWDYFTNDYLSANQSTLGWQATDGGTIEIRQDGVAGRAHNQGGYFAELDSHGYRAGATETLGLFQDIVTEVGKTYRFSFAYAARPGVDGNRNQLEAKFGNAFTQVFDGGNGRTADGQLWKTFTTDLVAVRDLTRVQFNYLGDRDTLGAHLDSISVATVPEPGMMAGLMLLGGLGAKSLKRRKQSAA